MFLNELVKVWAGPLVRREAVRGWPEAKLAKLGKEIAPRKFPFKKRLVISRRTSAPKRKVRGPRFQVTSSLNSKVLVARPCGMLVPAPRLVRPLIVMRGSPPSSLSVVVFTKPGRGAP